jgi:hypothetical protein
MADEEVAAIQSIVQALEPLDSEARGRVISYVFSRLGLRASVGLASPRAEAPPLHEVNETAPQLVDPRSFKQQKDPRSAIEMAAVVAYYLAEVAPPMERKDSIDAEDVKRYFKLAQFPLPGKVHMTLVHTKNAGYIDSVGEGRYRLNSVGYNLVAHNLPRGLGSRSDETGSTRRKRTTAKKAK